MRYFLPIAYKGYYQSAKENSLQEFDVNELNLKMLDMVVKSTAKESAR